MGYLVQLSRTYPTMFPYLRGFYNSMNGWRNQRDDVGWKMTTREWKARLELFEALDVEEEVEATLSGKKRGRKGKPKTQPERIVAVPRLQEDIFALTRLFSQSSPSERLIRGTAISEACYGFGDASKAGFGASWARTGGIKYRLGIWGKDEAENTSNWRELQNLVDALREESKDGGLKGVEVFLFTDNSTAESAFFNGSSKSRKLFELVLSLREMEIAQGPKIHLIHVSGKRMIEQGTDGLSRGQLTEGVMRGSSMQSFIPLNENVLERFPSFKLWVEEWMNEKKVEWLEPKD